MERTIKTVLISISSIKGYSRWVYRVVECSVNQRGYLSESGVRVVWESPSLYRPTTKSGRGQGTEAKTRAEQIRQAELAKVLGVKLAA